MKIIREECEMTGSKPPVPVFLDPVCKKPVKKECQIISDFEGEQYRFCSEDCKRYFDLEPEKYTRK